MNGELWNTQSRFAQVFQKSKNRVLRPGEPPSPPDSCRHTPCAVADPVISAVSPRRLRHSESAYYFVILARWPVGVSVEFSPFRFDNAPPRSIRRSRRWFRTCGRGREPRRGWEGCRAPRDAAGASFRLRPPFQWMAPSRRGWLVRRRVAGWMSRTRTYGDSHQQPFASHVNTSAVRSCGTLQRGKQLGRVNRCGQGRSCGSRRRGGGYCFGSRTHVAADLQFVAEHQYVRGGLDAHSHLVAGYLHDRHHDRIAQANSLCFLTRQNKHRRSSVRPATR